MNNLRKFEHILNEGISQEDLADALCHRIEMRYPDIYKKYDYDTMYDAVADVASFHAGAEELGSSDIGQMVREVFKKLENSQDVTEATWAGHSDTVKNPNFNDELSGRRISPPGKRLKSGGLDYNERTSQERTKALMKFKREKGGLTGPKGVLPEQDVAEDQLDELKCWTGYKRVSGTKAGAPGSCEKINELSTDKLADYKKAAAADARAADQAGDFARGNKRFTGIVKATKKQFDNETKPKQESAIMKGIQNETFGTPYPGTYEQEYGPFKKKGQERPMKIAFEGKKDVRR